MTRTGAPTLGLVLCLLGGCAGDGADGAGTGAAMADFGANDALVIARATLTAIADSADIGPGEGPARPEDTWLSPGTASATVQVERFTSAPGDAAKEYLLNVSLRDLRADPDGRNLSVAGDMRVFFDATSMPVVFAARSGRQLTIQGAAATATLRDYDLASEGILARAPDSYQRLDSIYDGSLTSSAFSGEVRFRTVLPFRTTGQWPAAPSQGQLEIYGAHNAVLRLTVVDDAVALELDADGNGRHEHRLLTSWASLTGRD